MAIRSDAGTDRIVAVHFLTRTFVWLLGASGIAWGAILLPLFWDQIPLDRMAAEILQGHRFKRQTLLVEAERNAAAERTSVCNPTELHNAVILNLSILNESLATADQTPVTSDYGTLYDASRRALACAPSDSFAWLVLFWVDVRQYGFEPHDATYLRQSYAFGPNEEWIALWRTRIAIALLPRLPADLSNLAIGEFVKLVETGRLYRETAALFGSAPPAVQSQIIDYLKTANETARQIFARTLYDNGLDVDIPGTKIPGLRPWER
jgi:hypothetical protein